MLSEMLLQPDTRPITHTQVVIEVNGICAGQVMMEAERVESDERQLAAAQEKHPHWQELIVLHTWVYTLPGTRSSTTHRAAITIYFCRTVVLLAP